MQLFEEQTPEIIRNRILSRMETTFQTREGSFAYDMVSPIAFEIWRQLMTLNEFIDAFYVDEYSGGYLDAHANLLALSRRQGSRASSLIHFTGRDGVVIPAGTFFFTAEGLQFELAEDVTLAEGVGTGLIFANEVGDIYNIGAGEITQILRNISGLASYVNDAADGGSSPESDEALFGRIDFRRKNPSTSGNENHYKEWALSCEGIGGVKVTRCWDGPGTVRVLVVDYDRAPVDEAIVAACYDYIETQRPVGAEVTVVSATSVPISVTATLTLADGASLEGVRTAFVSKLDNYLRERVAAYFADPEAYVYILPINRMAALLMDVDGVIDYENFQINGSTGNIKIAETSVPAVGEVEFS